MKAKKMLVALLALSFMMIAQADKAQSGAFGVYNNTSHAVTIAVGDYFPTSYKVNAHSSIVVHVSTDNQSIQINKVD